MRPHAWRSSLAVLLGGWLATTLACGRCGGGRDAIVVGRFEGGEVTAEELQREAARLPPVLRARFETDAGRRDLVGALVDKKLLAREARKRKLHEDPEVRRQVEELEERLVVQALLAEEERRAGPATEAELRAEYEASKGELTQPSRVQLRRVLAAVSGDAPEAERERARQRAERFRARLRAGEAVEKVAADGDGRENARVGDLGLVVIGTQEAAQERAVAALAAGQWSPVTAVREGFAVFQLLERRPSRTPPFEEARAEVGNRLSPQRNRRQFDDLLARLRAEAGVEIDLPHWATSHTPRQRK